MRFAAYAGTSVVLAAGTIVRAFYDRANFYSASVSIAQSNACLMILTNVALLAVSLSMLGLQRLFYGPLRPIEVEQLYEKAWFAITETCLAMTIFREEVGGWFLVMFVSLLIGKVWGWIGEGRVEILEQQPPANPRLFHAQLSVSLLISSLFDFMMLQYAVNTVLRHARPNMMVMFAFEFAVLTVASLSTAARYWISVFETNVIKKQIKERRDQLRRDRQQARAEAVSSEELPGQPRPTIAPGFEEDIETMDIDAPGWEEKGRWIFYLDLTTGFNLKPRPGPMRSMSPMLIRLADFFKLILYLTFFCVLCMFYGMPIHIIRDVALTIRSFYKRITDFVRYRQATRDMNARYPDATAEEIAREDVCIICREDMRPWAPPAPQNGQPARVEGNVATQHHVDERSRPKKLPCGHILHFACLRSWLERQQNCPTCRRPVLVPDTVVRNQAPDLPHQEARAQPQANAPHGRLPGQAGQNLIQPQNVYQFGPLRIAFGARQRPQVPQPNNVAPAPNHQAAIPTRDAPPRNQAVRQGAQPRTAANFSPATSSLQLQQIEQQLTREINGLRLQFDQLYLVRALQGELVRLRLNQRTPGAVSAGLGPGESQSTTTVPPIQANAPTFALSNPTRNQNVDLQNLPAGMTIPEGWTLLPLRRLSANAVEGQTASDHLTPGEPGPSTTSLPDSIQAQAPPDIPPSQGGSLATDPAADIGPTSLANEGGSTQTPAAVADISRDNSLIPGQASDRRAASSAGASSSIEIPHWGSATNDSGASPAETKGDETRGSDLDTTASSTTGVSAGSAAEGGRDKGKGRATAIEDSTEDVD